MNLMQKTTTKSENNKAEKFNNKINKYLKTFYSNGLEVGGGVEEGRGG